VDRLLEEARRMPPSPERLQTYREIERIVMDEVPLIPLYHEIVLYAWNPRVEAIDFGPYGMTMVPFSKMWIRDVAPSGLAGDLP
jgi:ABC-type transport system substrate-binding protein